MEARFGNIVFTSKFDSGNLDRVEKAEKDEKVDNERGMCVVFVFFFLDWFLFGLEGSTLLIFRPLPLLSLHSLIQRFTYNNSSSQHVQTLLMGS